MISVIMGVYNAEKYLRESIESILRQTYENFEFIIINDGSKDSSLKMIQEYILEDDRIKIINNQKNIGLTKSLNKAIKISKGEYIARMDADDIAHIERLEKQHKYLEQNLDVIVLGTSSYNINSKGDILNERNVPLKHADIQKVIKYVNPMIHSSVMFRKKEIEDIGNYNENYKKVQDFELWFRCLANDYKICNLPDRLLYYRVNEEYFERKSLKYRLIDLKVRFYGYKQINIPIYKRYGLFIPIVLGIIPTNILTYIYKYLKKYDPREVGN